MKSITKIKLELKNYERECLTEFIKIYEDDSRIGVRNLVETAKNKYSKYQDELSRLENLNQYENKLYSQGIGLIAGVDEVGRGPLAGPVVVASVILEKNTKIYEINDSKKLSEKKRNELFEVITKKAQAISIIERDNNYIDNTNILKATIDAMEESVNKLEKKAEGLIVDAVTLSNIKITQLNLVKADEKSISVAAASIIAKVTRDRIMEEFHTIYPMYNFHKNKGYGTKEHIDSIKKYGPCPIHRKTFLKNL